MNFSKKKLEKNYKKIKKFTFLDSNFEKKFRDLKNSVTQIF
jgi:hypothetical protein